jgi:hypothetical protein
MIYLLLKKFKTSICYNVKLKELWIHFANKVYKMVQIYILFNATTKLFLLIFKTGRNINMTMTIYIYTTPISNISKYYFLN